MEVTTSNIRILGVVSDMYNLKSYFIVIIDYFFSLFRLFIMDRALADELAGGVGRAFAEPQPTHSTLVCNPLWYIRDYMGQLEKPFKNQMEMDLMDFTIKARNGSLMINRVFIFLIGGSQVLPLLQEGKVELDMDIEEVKLIFNFICSNGDISEQFSEVSSIN